MGCRGGASPSLPSVSFFFFFLFFFAPPGPHPQRCNRTLISPNPELGTFLVYEARASILPHTSCASRSKAAPPSGYGSRGEGDGFQALERKSGLRTLPYFRAGNRFLRVTTPLRSRSIPFPGRDGLSSFGPFLELVL